MTGEPTVDDPGMRHIWVVPLLQAIAIAVMAVVTWVVHDPTPEVLDTTVIACEQTRHAADNPTGTVAPCP